jgi:hypothetical protein
MKIIIDESQLENMEYFSYLGSVITNDSSCTREIKSNIFKGKAAFIKKTIFTSKLDLNLRKRLVNRCICSIALYGAENWTLWKVDQKN